MLLLAHFLSCCSVLPAPAHRGNLHPVGHSRLANLSLPPCHQNPPTNPAATRIQPINTPAILPPTHPQPVTRTTPQPRRKQRWTQLRPLPPAQRRQPASQVPPEVAHPHLRLPAGSPPAVHQRQGCLGLQVPLCRFRRARAHPLPRACFPAKAVPWCCPQPTALRRLTPPLAPLPPRPLLALLLPPPLQPSQPVLPAAATQHNSWRRSWAAVHLLWCRLLLLAARAHSCPRVLALPPSQLERPRLPSQLARLPEQPPPRPPAHQAQQPPCRRCRRRHRPPPRLPRLGLAPAHLLEATPRLHQQGRELASP